MAFPGWPFTAQPNMVSSFQYLCTLFLLTSRLHTAVKGLTEALSIELDALYGMRASSTRGYPAISLLIVIVS